MSDAVATTLQTTPARPTTASPVEDAVAASPLGKDVHQAAFAAAAARDVIRHNSVLEAINGVMAEVAYVQKDYSKGLGYSYLSEAGLIAALRPSLVRHGLIIKPAKIVSITSDQYQTKNNATMNTRIVTCDYEILHAFTGQVFCGQMAGEGADVGDKALGKAITGALKYFVRETFNIEGGDEPEDQPSQEQERAQRPQGQNAPMTQPWHNAPQNAGPANHQQPWRNPQAQTNPGYPPATQQSGPPAGQPWQPGAQQQPQASQNVRPQHSIQEAFLLCRGYVQKAENEETLNKYRNAYRQRQFTPDQLQELDHWYFIRLAQFQTPQTANNPANNPVSNAANVGTGYYGASQPSVESSAGIPEENFDY